MGLIEALEEAGYPREQMFTNCSDLYVSGKKVCAECAENGYEEE